MVDASLRAHAEIAQTLSDQHAEPARGVGQPQGAGPMGRAHGGGRPPPGRLPRARPLRRQTAVEGTRALPDYTFLLPKGHALYMDVKFPLSGLPALPRGGHGCRAPSPSRRVPPRRAGPGAGTGAARVRQRSASGRRSTTYCCSCPTRPCRASSSSTTRTWSTHALGQKVVLCSPLTLFAFLGVIRQAFDNFVIEQTSDEILRLLGPFGQQWVKYKESLGRRRAAVRPGAP